MNWRIFLSAILIGAVLTPLAGAAGRQNRNRARLGDPAGTPPAWAAGATAGSSSSATMCPCARPGRGWHGGQGHGCCWRRGSDNGQGMGNGACQRLRLRDGTGMHCRVQPRQ
jgi:hypothetical protein